MAKYAEGTEPLHPAYVAGIIDGEGSLAIYSATLTEHKGTKHQKQTLRYNMGIVVTNNCYEILERLRNQYGGLIMKKRKDLEYGWRWKIDSADAERVLLDVRPYLIIKTDQCTLALLFRSTFSRNNCKAGVPLEIMATRDDMKSRMKGLNQRMRNPGTR